MKHLILLLLLLFITPAAFAQFGGACPTTLCIGPGSGTTYYVSRNGSDSNDGLAKVTGGGHGPWLHSHGMKSATGVAASTTPTGNQNVIFEGCQTWPSTDFSFSGSPGSAGNYVYYGVDKTWWDSTVSGCATSWNRPIFDGGGEAAPFQGFAATGVGCSAGSMWCPGSNYNVLDGIEFRNYLNVYGGSYVNSYQGSTGLIVQNCYFHKFVEHFFTIGTGNIAANSTTITGYKPFAYSPVPVRTDWLSQLPTHGSTTLDLAVYGYTPGGAQIGITSISCVGGSGINCTGGTWTFGTNISARSNACNGCIVQIGFAGGTATQGNGGQCFGCAMYYNVMDARDGLVYQMNPYADCGVSEGNNNACLTELWGGFRQPGIWVGNEVYGACNGHVGDVGLFALNTFEYFRPCSNPTAHTNAVETTGLDTYNNATAFYGNVARHLGTDNPNVPGGQFTIGVPVQLQSNTGTTTYVFNNVGFDTTENGQGALFQRGSPNVGTQRFFNNSMDCGPENDLTKGCANGANSQDTAFNNYFVTTAQCPTLFDNGACPASNWPCGNCLTQTSAQATAAGYLPTSTYAYSPPAGGATIGAGQSITGTCSAFATAFSSTISTASSDCLHDTPYGVVTGTINGVYQITGPGRVSLARPSTPSIGAYEFSGAAAPPIPGNLTGTVSGSSVVLNWNAVTGTLSGYHVYRSNINGGPYTQIATVLAPTTTYTDTPGNGTWYYTVTSFNTNGESGKSNQVTAVLPSNLTVNAVPSTINFGSVNLGSSSPPTTITVTNTSTSGGAVTISNVTIGGTNPGDFALSLIPTIVQSTTINCGVATTCAKGFTNPATAGNYVIVGTWDGSAASVTPIYTDSGGNSYSVAKQCNLATDGDTIAMGYAKIATTGPLTVTFADSGANGNKRMWIMEVSNLAASSVLDQTSSCANQTAVTQLSTGSITSTQANTFLLAFFSNAGTASNTGYAAGPGYTIVNTIVSGGTTREANEFQNVTSIGTYNASISMNSAGAMEMGGFLVNFKGNISSGGLNTCTGVTLPKNGTCQFQTTFTPTASGVRSATASVNGTASTSIALSGTGGATTPGINLQPAALTFGPTLVGSNASSIVTLLNNGSGTLTISSIAMAIGTNYSQVNTCGSSVASNASCTITVTFSPTTTGTVSDTLQITDNAAGSPHTVGVTGTGTTTRAAVSGHVTITGSVLVH